MKKFITLSVLISIFTTFLPATVIYKGTCESSFSGTSTLRNFSGHVTSKPFKVVVVEKNEELIARWETPVLVKKMKTSNSIQDSKMYKMFNYLEFPTIEGLFSDINISRLSKNASMPFTLRIRKNKKIINAKISNWKTNDSKISFTLTFPVFLSDFNLKPPSLLGTIKVGDEVSVKSQFKLTKQ